MPVTVTLVDHPLVADSLARIRDRDTPNPTFRNNLERIGTLNYPNVARTQGLNRFPTLEVAIESNGKLHEVIIRQSSGVRGLDQAAINIVSLSAPFDPFPEFLRQEYDILRFAYEWRFTDGYAYSQLSPAEALDGDRR